MVFALYSFSLFTKCFHMHYLERFSSGQVARKMDEAEGCWGKTNIMVQGSLGPEPDEGVNSTDGAQNTPLQSQFPMPINVC